MTTADDSCEATPEEEPCPVKRTFRIIMCELAEMRPTLIVFGLIALLMSYQTHYGYTTSQLPGRDLCAMLLLSMGVVGLSCAVLKPTPPAREWFGLALMLHSAIRGAAFAIVALRNDDSFVRSVQKMSPVSAHAFLAFLGFLLWARAHRPTAKGEGPA